MRRETHRVERARATIADANFHLNESNPCQYIECDPHGHAHSVALAFTLSLSVSKASLSPSLSLSALLSLKSGGSYPAPIRSIGEDESKGSQQRQFRNRVA